jgi:hypothetical protein
VITREEYGLYIDHGSFYYLSTNGLLGG